MWPVRAALNLQRAGRELWSILHACVCMYALIGPMFVQYGLVRSAVCKSKCTDEYIIRSLADMTKETCLAKGRIIRI